MAQGLILKNLFTQISDDNCQKFASVYYNSERNC